MPVGFTACPILPPLKVTSKHDLKKGQNALRHFHSSKRSSAGWDWSVCIGAIQHLVYHKVRTVVTGTEPGAVCLP